MEGEGGKCKKNLARVQYKGNKEDGGRCPVTSSRGIVAFLAVMGDKDGITEAPLHFTSHQVIFAP